jgi:putative pyruvate formate lyase activating enzyme
MKTNRREFLHKMLLLPAGVLLSGLINSSRLFATKLPKTSLMISENQFQPGYLKLHKNGDLKIRGEILWDMMRGCRLCPRDCGKNRIRGRRGECGANSTLEISSAHAHFGEEPQLVGSHGSGTIFFTHCALHCVFCINYEVSHLGIGSEHSIRQLADLMLLMQRKGCHNLNVVSPSHYIPHIVLALDIAASRGLVLPLVYNTSGWEKTDILFLLDGIVDVYLTDFKYFDSNKAKKFSIGADTYPQLTKMAVLEMNRQVGLASPDKETGIINRGLMIRHLVMPNNVSGSEDVMKWIAENLPKDTYVNIMSQYTPVFNATKYPEISRRINAAEYRAGVDAARKAGLTNLHLQSPIGN